MIEDIETQQTERVLISGSQIHNNINKHHEAVSRICYPLFKRTYINYFDYIRYYDSGEMIAIGTCPDFTANCCIDHLYPSFEEFQAFNSMGIKMTHMTECLPLPSSLDPEKYQENIALATRNRIYHRLYLIDRGSNYFSSYGFGITREIKSIFNFYLNSLGIFEQFIKYFEHHAKELISVNSQYNRILMPHYYEKRLALEESPVESLYCSHLDFSFKHNNFTSREMECLALIAQGYTMKSAAKRLQISPRTVEQHLRNIKEKHGINTKNQLVEIWHDIYKFSFTEHDA